MKLKPKSLYQYHVFLASPGDVAIERQHVRKFFDAYNRQTAHIWGVQFEVVDWENCSTIGVGRPQELITKQTLEESRESLALVIGIMAQRFGSPSGKAESGTEEEFNWAMETHKSSGFPEIKWFFRKVDTLEFPSDPDAAEAALEQWKKVLAFRKRMKDFSNPVFYAEYQNSAGFAEVFERDLNKWLADPERPWAKALMSHASATECAAAMVPTVEFDSESYRAAVIKKFDKLNFEMLDTTGAFYSPVRLWNVFVPQSVRECHQYNPRLLEIPKEHQRRLLDAGEITEKELKDAELYADLLRQDYFSQPIYPVLDVVVEALNGGATITGNKLVILGDPGSGKSSLIRYLALRWAGIAEQAIRDTQPIPLVVELGAYARWQCDGRRDLIRYLEEGPVWHVWKPGLLSQMLEQPRRMVLLLDGLDEVFDLSTRGGVVNDIQRFCSQFANVPILLTSRVVGYQAQTLREADFQHFMLQDLDFTQMTDFMNRWHEVTFEDPSQAVSKRERLQKAIHESKSIAMLAGNPLLLTMMAVLNRNQELPRDRADLYAQASRVLLYQWDTERALEDFPGISNEIGLREKTEILRRIAAHMQAGPGGLKGNLIDGSTLTRLIEDYLHNDLHFAQARAAARTVVEQLRMRNFILCFMGADSYAFVHRTFLEFFCAAEFVHKFNVAKTLDIDDLLKLYDQHCRDDEWLEVLRLICGQIDEQFVGRIVQDLTTRADITNWNGITPLPELPLAIWCLNEARNTHKLLFEGELLVNTVIQFLVECHGEIPQEDSSSYTHAEIWKFIDADLLTPIISLSGRLPGGDLLKENAVGLVDKLKGGGLWSWSKIVASLVNDRGILERLTESNRFLVRRGAIEELTARPEWVDESTKKRLKLIATGDVNGYPRVAAIEGLINCWNDEQTKGFVAGCCVTDPLGWVRRCALQLLVAKWPDQATRDLLAERAVQDVDSDPRKVALQTLSDKWPDQSTRDLLVQCAVRDEDKYIRSTLLQVLADKWQDQNTRELLTERMVNDKDYYPRRAALLALVDKWPDQITHDLLDECAIKDKDVKLRQDAKRRLADKWPDRSFVPESNP
ncbi:MAG TPA: hypothetical protein DF774_04945 [Rheinheimera sp.]|uniref:NACHT domain-containing protein n=1 Tax=Rheinheimera sp. TaxID=1869214 RepID=UPI000ED9CA3A|nr:NACHT domain-containing protein [Rheinheimera sp.]HCU65091.1 hypothetical protein [Rheinheimera sp.]